MSNRNIILPIYTFIYTIEGERNDYNYQKTI